MLARLTASLQLLRPRTMRQMHSSLERSHNELSTLTDAVHTLSRNIQMLQESVQQHRDDLQAVRLREAQLRAVARRNLELESRREALEDLLQDSSTCQHVRQAIEHATLSASPFPYMVVDDLLPNALYEALMLGLPPRELFADRPPNKQQLAVPFDLAPDYSRRVWHYLSASVVRSMVTPTVLARFARPLEQWLGSHFPSASDVLANLHMVPNDGRILLRTNGYHIPPHRDPKWAFMTCILYLARPRDERQWGTDLYSVTDDHEAQGAAPYWIPTEQCQRVRSVGFHRNRALVFLNSTGAHGATIPDDPTRPDIERYIYQFRIGPDADSMAALTASLPPDRRAAWDGKGYLPS